MIDFRNTIIKSIESNIKKLSLQAIENKTQMWNILTLIIIDDLIEWSKSVVDASSKVTEQLVSLRNKLVRDYYEDLKICRYHNTPNEFVYANVNTPQASHDWDRVWDNPNCHILTVNRIPESKE